MMERAIMHDTNELEAVEQSLNTATPAEGAGQSIEGLVDQSVVLGQRGGHRHLRSVRPAVLEGRNRAG
ncbi:MAG: hypothetical protein M5R38_02405 [Candidatus Methylomirabilis sp.]|nr:hypothetical protein [Candidatus Methylomirabilis sp.]